AVPVVEGTGVGVGWCECDGCCCGDTVAVLLLLAGDTVEVVEDEAEGDAVTPVSALEGGGVGVEGCIVEGAEAADMVAPLPPVGGPPTLAMVIVVPPFSLRHDGCGLCSDRMVICKTHALERFKKAS